MTSFGHNNDLFQDTELKKIFTEYILQNVLFFLPLELEWFHHLIFQAS